MSNSNLVGQGGCILGTNFLLQGVASSNRKARRLGRKSRSPLSRGGALSPGAYLHENERAWTWRTLPHTYDDFIPLLSKMRDLRSDNRLVQVFFV
jgi:hypothetical protein